MSNKPRKARTKTNSFFAAPTETSYDREMEQNFMSRYYRELCLTAMGTCMAAFGITLTIVAVDKNITDLFILGPVPLVIGVFLLIMATGFTIRRYMDRSRNDIRVDFVESPEKLFLKRALNRTPAQGATPAQGDTPASEPPKKGQPKSCLRKSSVSGTIMSTVRQSVDETNRSPHLVRKLSRTDIPTSPICPLPEVGGHDGESVRSTPEKQTRSEVFTIDMKESEEVGGYPSGSDLIQATPIAVLPGPAEYISPGDDR